MSISENSAEFRLVAVSDTHMMTSALSRAMPLFENADAVVHLGDMVRDARKLQQMLQRPIISVLGNNDYEGAPPDFILTPCGKRIWLTHGHRYGVKQGHNLLALAARERNADAVLYGHTHKADIAWEGPLLIINPGAAMLGTAAEIIITAEAITPRIVQF